MAPEGVGRPSVGGRGKHVSAFHREHDKPLGLGPRRRSLRPARRDWLAGACFALICGGSAAIALAERPWRIPAETPPAIAEAPAQAPAAPPAAEPTSGAKVIKVAPQSTPGISDPAAFPKSTVAAWLPDPALVEESAAGPLPIRAADGRRPFDVYARPLSSSRGARVAIVIGGLGISQTGTQTALQRLPKDVSLAFAPDGNSLGRWMQEARRENREILLQLPLEPFDYPNVDPGRYTLKVDASAEDNTANLHRSLARTTNYVGVMNYMGGRFLAESTVVTPLMQELGRRGLMVFDDGSTPRSLAGEAALAAQAPYAQASVTLDASRDRGAILRQLDALEKAAHSSGTAIGVGSAFEVTVDAIAAWAPGAASRGIEIVPVSALAIDPERR